MPIIKVLTNAKGNILGTARADIAASGPGAPQQVTLVAQPGQRLVELSIDDKLTRLDADALHTAIRSSYVRGKSDRGKAGGGKAKRKASKKK